MISKLLKILNLTDVIRSQDLPQNYSQMIFENILFSDEIIPKKYRVLSDSNFEGFYLLVQSLNMDSNFAKSLYNSMKIDCGITKLCWGANFSDAKFLVFSFFESVHPKKYTSPRLKNYCIFIKSTCFVYVNPMITIDTGSVI